jgi:hypothetical protein
MKQRTKSKTVTSVAVILERELNSTIKEWLERVSLVPDLTSIPLSDADRTLYLPKLIAGHWRELDQNQVLSDVMIIADEANRQLTEAVSSFMTAQAAAVYQDY